MAESYGVHVGACEDVSTMIRVIRICRKCGAKILSDAPEGLCPKCVLRTALGNFTDASVTGGGLSAVASAKADDSGNSDESARESKKTARAAELLGELGDYELLEEVGRGGQGVVFRARQKSLNRTVALKVISLGQWASKAHLRRFRLEAEAAARLEHPGIVPIHEVGERDGSCYFSMKFVEGGQLDEVVKRTPISIQQAAELIAKVARTVDYAHEHGILHRDIKPGNILLDGKGEPHLTDFGLARLVESESSVTQTLDVLGTPSYMAPEQAVGNNAAVSSVTDVYGLGAVLYQLLTGHPPFAGGTTYETIKLLEDTEPRQPRLWNPKIDRDLSTICLKCLEKDPKRRYPSAVALAEDLERWLRHEPINARRVGVITRGRKWVRRNPGATVMAALLLSLAVPLGVIIWKSVFVRPPRTTAIAVLPFENLSEDKKNIAFADGIQDDILTKLAKVSDLKVISRTSVMEYRGKRNVRQIGNQLRASHVLGGSVRRSGGRIRLNAQLIDTRTDTHIWAEQYDRDLNELFAIQSEIAQKIAGQLHAKVSAAEKLAIERRPTGDLVAFDLYARANDLLTAKPGGKREWFEAIDLLNRAVARDPSFLGAYCQLAEAHDRLYFNEVDHTPARLELAKTAIEDAFRIRPGAGEAHLAQGEHLYRGHRDYDKALAELQIARQTLPNNARIFQLMGFIQKRQGRWEQWRQSLEQALELDPRDLETLKALAEFHQKFGRYAESKQWLTRAVAVAEADDVSVKLRDGEWQLEVTADPRPLHQTIDSIRATGPAAARNVADLRLECALAERDAAAATEALNVLDEDEIGVDEIPFNHAFVEGVIARMANDDQRAQLAFATARTEQAKVVHARPDFGPAWCALGLIDAALGRKEDALREGRRAIDLLPIEKDALVGRYLVRHFAVIAAWVGEKDLACEQLATLRGPPSFLHYGDLKLMPQWDPLRGEPCFERIVASVAPR